MLLLALCKQLRAVLVLKYKNSKGIIKTKSQDSNQSILGSNSYGYTKILVTFSSLVRQQMYLFNFYIYICTYINIFIYIFPYSVVIVQFFPGGSDGKECTCSAGDLSSIPGSARAPGEGNGNPLQHPCLEHPTDREAWQTTGSQSWTQLSD